MLNMVFARRVRRRRMEDRSLFQGVVAGTDISEYSTVLGGVRGTDPEKGFSNWGTFFDQRVCGTRHSGAHDSLNV